MIFTKASGLNDSLYGKRQEPIKMFIEQEEEAYLKNSQIDNIFNVMSTDKFAESFGSLTSKGNFAPVGEGGKYPRNTQQEGYRKVIEPDEWKNSFEVTETMIEDATLFDVKGRAKDFMLSYTRTREQFGATILNSGYNTTATFAGKSFNIAGADALALFDAAHTSITGETGVQSNAANDMPFNYDNLCTIEERMQKFTDDNGNLLSIQPDTIIIPNNARIKKLVFDAVATEKGAPNTANNSFNYNFGRWNVIVWNQLQNPASATNDIWFLADSQRNAIDGLVWLDRVPLGVRSWVDNETGNNVFGGRARFGCAPVNWRVIYGCFPGVTL